MMLSLLIENRRRILSLPVRSRHMSRTIIKAAQVITLGNGLQILACR